MLVKGFCQIEIIPKIRSKLGLVRPHPPHYPIFFGNILKHENNAENKKKHKISKKN